MGNQAIRDYLRHAAERVPVVGSVCTGALVLAAAGLLEGRTATTHWAYHRLLERLGARCVPRRWVEDGKFITSAGVSAGIDMALALVARLTDEATARMVQVVIEYDPHPPFGGIDWSQVNRDIRELLSSSQPCEGQPTTRTSTIVYREGAALALGRRDRLQPTDEERPMDDSRQAWDQVGRDFTDLGQHVKRHYQQQGQASQPAPEDRRRVEAALRQLRDSLDQAFTALGEAIRDPEFGEQAEKTANSLGDALSSTFAEVGQRFGSKPPRDDRSAEDG